MGRVIGYNFLWSHEAETGEETGRKARPVLIFHVKSRDPGLQVWVVPFTSRPPDRSDYTVDVPRRVQAHLGLSKDASHIVASEINVFDWPGPDLNGIPDGTDNVEIGEVPERLVLEVRATILAASEDAELITTHRSV